MIKVFDSTVTLLGVIPDYENLKFKRGWNEAGSFSFELSGLSDFKGLAVKDNIIYLDEYHAGWIDTVVTERKDGEDVISVSGIELKDMLAWRYTDNNHVGFTYTNQTPEAIVKDLIAKNIGASCVDTDRVVSIINVVSSAGKGTAVDFTSYHKQLDDEVYSLLAADGLGLSATLNASTKKIDFDVVAGTDRTTSQSVNNRVMLSVDMRTLDDITYKTSNATYRNYAFVGGQGEGNSRTVVDVGTATGLARREVFIDARDVTTTDELTDRGTQKLAEYAQDESIACSVRDTGTYTYLTDYDLGDYVTAIDNQIGITKDAQITSITETWSGQKPVEISVQLGYDTATLEKALARSFRASKLLTSYGTGGYLNLLAGTPTTLDPGESAAFGLVKGEGNDYTLNLSIPRGNTGSTGPANTLSIGTVTTLAYDADATATITGTAPTQTLSLGIPVGVPGSDTLTLGETATDAHRGDHGKIAYDGIAELNAPIVVVPYDKLAAANNGNLSYVNRWMLNQSVSAGLTIESVQLAITASTSGTVEVDGWTLSGGTYTRVFHATKTTNAVGTLTVDVDFLTTDVTYISVCTTGSIFIIAYNTASGHTLRVGDKTSTSIAATSWTVFYNLAPNVKVNCTQENKAIDRIEELERKASAIITVDASGNGDYTTIQAAVTAATSGDTILIYPGTYQEQVAAFGKIIHLVGVNKQTCILYDDSADYATPPLELGNGSVQNMTIIEDHSNPAPALVGTTNWELAYCVHVEDFTGTYNTGAVTLIENCILRNTKRAALGMGTYKNHEIIVRNCDIWSGAPTREGDYHRGAAYFHSMMSAFDAQNQRVRFINCRLRCDDSTVIYIGDPSQAGYTQDMEVEFINCMAWSEIDGKADSIVTHPFAWSDVVSLADSSYGNNVAMLNA